MVCEAPDIEKWAESKGTGLGTALHAYFSVEGNVRGLKMATRGPSLLNLFTLTNMFVKAGAAERPLVPSPQKAATPTMKFATDGRAWDDVHVKVSGES